MRTSTLEKGYDHGIRAAEGVDRVMGADDVLEVVGRLEAAGVEVWLDGGWGVDALLC